LQRNVRGSIRVVGLEFMSLRLFRPPQDLPRRKEGGGGVMSTKPIGMYGETPRVTIGEYSICRQDDTSVWIEHESGEGAQFSDESFEECIKDFYNKHF